ncbi:MAG: glycosyltransferase family 2 protein [Actinomycetota bacterium]|nr:glycosyltransferase family 2 protein [Actinomycetota bacterium]
MLIGAALIVRDEQRCLARCLASLQPFIDEIVVVDTGSLDSSVAIAESFGAVVLHRTWDGDFAAARNLGLDHLSSEIVLYIDADEWAAPTTREQVEASVRDRAEHVAYRVKLRHRPGFSPYQEYRMWVNRPDLRFTGVIHESIVPAITAVADAENLAIGAIDLLLEHDGYEQNQAAKHARNLPLLEDQLRNDPNRTYLWDHIGRIYGELGRDADSRAAFGRGVELVRANGVLDVADAQVYADLIFTNATHETPDAALVTEAVDLFEEHALVRWSCALDSLARKAYYEVTAHIDRLLSISEEQMADYALGINLRIQHEWAFHVRGMARFELGDYAGAAADFGRAELADPQNLAYRTKRILAQARSRRPST